MDESSVIAYINEQFRGVESMRTEEYTFFFYGADRMLPFATIAHADHESDKSSQLDRPGVFRLNVGVTRDTYRGLFGEHKPRLGPGGIVDTGHDFSVLDRLLPHPVYAPQSWISVLNPSPATFEEVKPLLQQAYERAVHRAEKHETHD